MGRKLTCYTRSRALDIIIKLMDFLNLKSIYKIYIIAVLK